MVKLGVSVAWGREDLPGKDLGGDSHDSNAYM